MKLIEAFLAYEKPNAHEEPFAIYKNPTRAELKSAANEREFLVGIKSVRAFLHGADLYAFNPRAGTHQAIANTLKIRPESILPVGMILDNGYRAKEVHLSWTVHGTRWNKDIGYTDNGYDATPLIDAFKKNEHFRAVAAPSVGFAFEEE